jgi:hypothetical protein
MTYCHHKNLPEMLDDHRLKNTEIYRMNLSKIVIPLTPKKDAFF